MDIELVELLDFLSAYHPYDLLPREALAELPARMEAAYARKGRVFLEPGDPCDHLYIIRTGAVETYSPDGQLLARLGEGDAFGIHALLAGGTVINRVLVLEDSLFYLLPAHEFERLRREYPQFAYFFAPLGASRLRAAQAHGGRETDEHLDLMSLTCAELSTRDPVAIAPGTSVRDAAAAMREARISCLLVTEGEKLLGIMTDRDLRNRIVANGESIETPVEKIMTPDPITLDADSFAFDALLAMTRHNIHHLPITRDGRIKGVVTNTDVISTQTTSAIQMAGQIAKKTTYEGLAQVVAKIPRLLVHLVNSGASARNVGHIVTSITDAVTLRLLKLAEKDLGPAPIPYLWVASGSQARQEQTGTSDQDNFMILDDSYSPAEHGAYFEALARFVCDGLNACGYIYCPGEVMAITPKWRQPLSVWKDYFRGWIGAPEPKALMHSCIFFDLRPIHGETRLFDELQAMVLEMAKGNSLFLAHMVTNALSHTPPLGFFRNFVLIRGGEHDHQFDLKHNGVVPIVDIARIYALEAGLPAVNTFERLAGEKEAKVLSRSGARDLLDAYEFISITRLRHQVNQINSGRKPDNFMAPDALSHFERNHLKDAFSVVKTIQGSMAAFHQAG